jgi:hypothetical protein
MPRPKSPPMKRKANEVQAPTTSATEAEAEADAPRRQRLNSQTAEATSHGTCKKKVEQSPAKQWVIAERFEWLADWETTFLHKGMSEINKNRFRHVLNMVNPSEQRDYLLDRFLKKYISVRPTILRAGQAKPCGSLCWSPGTRPRSTSTCQTCSMMSVVSESQ